MTTLMIPLHIALVIVLLAPDSPVNLPIVINVQLLLLLLVQDHGTAHPVRSLIVAMWTTVVYAEQLALHYHQGAKSSSLT